MVTQANLEMKNVSHTEYINTHFRQCVLLGGRTPAVGKITRIPDVIEGPKKHLQSLVGQVFEHLVMNVIWSEPQSE